MPAMGFCAAMTPPLLVVRASASTNPVTLAVRQKSQECSASTLSFSIQGGSKQQENASSGLLCSSCKIDTMIRCNPAVSPSAGESSSRSQIQPVAVPQWSSFLASSELRSSTVICQRNILLRLLPFFWFCVAVITKS